MAVIEIEYDTAVKSALRDINSVTATLARQGGAVTEATALQNKMALASTKAEKAAAKLANAQEFLQLAVDSDSASIDHFTREVQEAQVALDRESIAVVNAAQKLDRLEKEALEAALAEQKLALAANRVTPAIVPVGTAASKSALNIKQFANAGLGMVGMNASMASSLGPVGIALGVVGGAALAVGKAYQGANALAREFATPDQLARINAADTAWVTLKGTIADFNAKGGTATDIMGTLNESIAAHINVVSISLVRWQLMSGQIDTATANMKIGKIITGEYAAELDKAGKAANVFQDALGKVANNAANANAAHKGSLIGVARTDNGSGGTFANPAHLAQGGFAGSGTVNNSTHLAVTIQGGTFTGNQGDAKKLAEQLGPHIVAYLRNTGISLPGTGNTRP